MAFLDWNENAQISNDPPAVYWPVMTATMDPEKVRRQQHLHALPVGWEQLGYTEFLDRRRPKIAGIIREGFEVLRAEGVSTVSADAITAADLAGDIESNVLEFKSTARYNLHTGEKDPRLEHVIVKTVAGS